MVGLSTSPGLDISDANAPVTLLLADASLATTIIGGPYSARWSVLCVAKKGERVESGKIAAVGFRAGSECILEDETPCLHFARAELLLRTMGVGYVLCAQQPHLTRTFCSSGWSSLQQQSTHMHLRRSSSLAEYGKPGGRAAEANATACCLSLKIDLSSSNSSYLLLMVEKWSWSEMRCAGLAKERAATATRYGTGMQPL